MNNPTPTNNDPQTQAPTQTPTSGELTFSEYEARRRAGKSIEESAAKSAPDAKASEQKPPVKSDTTGDETEELSEDDAKDLSETDGDDSDKDKPRKKGGFQRRIDKLNARVAAREQELEYWRSQVMKNGPGDAKSEPVATKQAPAADGKPNPEHFETHTEYVEALADWKLDQRETKKANESKQAERENAQNAALKAHSERVKAFSEKNDDFMDAMENLDDVRVSPEVQELIIGSEHGPALLYELAKNKAEAKRFAGLSVTAAARELGKFEARLDAQNSSAEDKEPESKKLTKAPKPLEPLSAGSSKVVKKTLSDPDLSFAEYERIRREQKRRR